MHTTIKKIRLKTCKGGFAFTPGRGKRKYIRCRDKQRGND